MNAVEIEEAVSDLASHPFDPDDFPYAFLTAFGNKDTTIKRLRSGQTNGSDIPGGVLQRNNIHIAVCVDGTTSKTLGALRNSSKTASAKAKFILATDGISLEAEDLTTGEPIACVYQDFAKHFGFFLPLAGISTVKEIKNNPFDIKATGRLNKLYVELLKDNPDWATEAKRPALNQFIARLIFCFFAEDTSIFHPKQFTKTIEQMSDGQSGNTNEILCELFRAMDLKSEARETAKIKNWANVFPYVNGGMFAGGAECPKFSRISRSYLLAVGNLEWDKINPDIFGSMIQAVADDDERGELGMHYTSVPNILKVLNPLFLDDLREHLQGAGDNVRKLRNLRKRLSTIRLFDPACGSGNFLVIAYKEMRAVEHEIVKRTSDEPKSWIKLDNFFGIEIKSFAVEIARLALLIAEFQCDVRYISQQEARAMVLPLHRTGQITVGNALRTDWLSSCPSGFEDPSIEHELAGPTGRLALDPDGPFPSDETYVCGNPPYKGSQDQTPAQKADLETAFAGRLKSTKSADYVAGWFIKAHDFVKARAAKAAFVTTNSINQGRQVSLYWPLLLSDDVEIFFAVPSFRWSNLASRKAVVTVSIVGLARKSTGKKLVFTGDQVKEARFIGAYLVPDQSVIVSPASEPICALSPMTNGSMPNDGGGLLLSPHEARDLERKHPTASRYIRKFVGSNDTISGEFRYCLWLEGADSNILKLDPIAERVEAVLAHRLKSDRPTTNELAKTPQLFGEIRHPNASSLVIPRHSAEDRPYLPFDVADETVVIGDSAIMLPNFKLYEASIYASRLHLVWVATVCGKIKTDFRYSNTLGWNTFPLPALTERNKADLEECVKQILLARESHFPATIAELYDPDDMGDDLRRAHEGNDDVLERIYIGRRFRNDTERLEKLFELYTGLTKEKPQPTKKGKRAA